MENLIRKMKAGKIPAEAALVISDNPQAPALEKAKKLGVESVMIGRKDFATRQEFEAEIIRHIEEKKIDLLLLAGFMRILSAEFVRKYKGGIINIHPSLLPQFPGARGIREAWEAKVPITGVTVHFVDESVDTGQVILQRPLSIQSGETLESLEARIHAMEYEIYPEAVNLVLAGKARL